MREQAQTAVPAAVEALPQLFAEEDGSEMLDLSTQQDSAVPVSAAAQSRPAKQYVNAVLARNRRLATFLEDSLSITQPSQTITAADALAAPVRAANLGALCKAQTAHAAVNGVARRRYHALCRLAAAVEAATDAALACIEARVVPGVVGETQRSDAVVQQRANINSQPSFDRMSFNASRVLDGSQASLVGEGFTSGVWGGDDMRSSRGGSFVAPAPMYASAPRGVLSEASLRASRVAHSSIELSKGKVGCSVEELGGWGAELSLVAKAVGDESTCDSSSHESDDGGPVELPELAPPTTGRALRDGGGAFRPRAVTAVHGRVTTSRSGGNAQLPRLARTAGGGGAVFASPMAAPSALSVAAYAANARQSAARLSSALRNVVRHVHLLRVATVRLVTAVAWWRGTRSGRGAHHLPLPFSIGREGYAQRLVRDIESFEGTILSSIISTEGNPLLLPPKALFDCVMYRSHVHGVAHSLLGHLGSVVRTRRQRSEARAPNGADGRGAARSVPHPLGREADADAADGEGRKAGGRGVGGTGGGGGGGAGWRNVMHEGGGGGARVAASAATTSGPEGGGTALLRVALPKRSAAGGPVIAMSGVSSMPPPTSSSEAVARKAPTGRAILRPIARTELVGARTLLAEQEGFGVGQKVTPRRLRGDGEGGSRHRGGGSAGGRSPSQSASPSPRGRESLPPRVKGGKGGLSPSLTIAFGRLAVGPAEGRTSLSTRDGPRGGLTPRSRSTPANVMDRYFASGAVGAKSVDAPHHEVGGASSSRPGSASSALSGFDGGKFRPSSAYLGGHGPPSSSYGVRAGKGGASARTPSAGTRAATAALYDGRICVPSNPAKYVAANKAAVDELRGALMPTHDASTAVEGEVSRRGLPDLPTEHQICALLTLIGLLRQRGTVGGPFAEGLSGAAMHADPWVASIVRPEGLLKHSAKRQRERGGAGAVGVGATPTAAMWTAVRRSETLLYIEERLPYFVASVESEHAAAVTVQKYVRRWLMRKRFLKVQQHLNGNASGSAKAYARAILMQARAQSTLRRDNPIVAMYTAEFEDAEQHGVLGEKEHSMRDGRHEGSDAGVDDDDEIDLNAV